MNLISILLITLQLSTLHNLKQIHCTTWGPPQGGRARGPCPPPPDFTGETVMHLPPPQILGKTLLCTRFMQCFSLKQTMECIHNSVYFIKIFLNLQIFLKKLLNLSIKFQKFIQFLQCFSQNTLTCLIYSKCLTLSQNNLKVNKIISTLLKILHYTKNFLKVSNNFLKLFNNKFNFSLKILNYILNYF